MVGLNPSPNLSVGSGYKPCGRSSCLNCLL